MRKVLGAFILLFFGLTCGFLAACSAHIRQVASTSGQAGLPVQLAFQTQPSSSAGAGVTFSTMPIVAVEDSNGNVITSATNSITVAAYTDSSCTVAAPGTFSVTTNPISASSGVASFSGLNYGGAVTTIYIGASSSGLTSTCSTAISITPGTPTHLVYAMEPSSTAGSGVALTSQPVLDIEDAYGNVVTSASNSVTLAAYTNNTCSSAAGGTFGATTNPLSASSGVGTFAGVNYTGASGTTIHIGASSSGLTSTCSTAISITPGNPAKLLFATEPSSSGTAGVAFSTQPTVTVEDSYGNVVTSASNAVTLAAYTNSTCTTAGTGTFGATTNPLNPTSGVAPFAGVNYTKSGTFYIGASSSGLTNACSNAISVAAGPPANLQWWAGGTSPLVNSCELVQFAVDDQYYNTATVTGSALTVNLVSGGSAKYYSDSGCTSQITTETISIGGSSTPGFYTNDSVAESEGAYATATGVTSATTKTIVWKLKPILSFSPTTFATGTCVPFTITLEDAKGTVMAVPDNETVQLNGPGQGTTFTNNICTTTISPNSLNISSGQSSVTYYFSDARAETVAPTIWPVTGSFIVIGPVDSTTITANTANTLRITGPTFEPPSTCAGPYTITSTDNNLNPSNISGSALTVNLSATGSAAFSSNSSCTGPPISSVSIGVGTDSQTFYVEDSATEISTITATATSFTSGTFNYDSIATSPLEQVAVGGPFTCVLISGGVKCWGNNWVGELGNGTTTNSFTPVSVSGLTSGVSSIVSTTDYNGDGLFSCALKTDNTIWCWGRGYGIVTMSTPSEIMLSGSPLLATQISIGGNEACAITSAGAVYCWGVGTPNTTTPTEIVSSGVVSVAALDDHTCATLTGGDLKCWGDNASGQLGIGSTGGTYSTPQQVNGLTTSVANIAVSRNSTCAVVSGAVYCWSTNVSYGQSANTDTPALVGSPLTSGVSSIVGGDTIYDGNDFFFALTTSGALYGWGANSNPNNGIFGNGATTGYSYTSPYKIFSSGVQSVSAAMYNIANACAIVSGNLMCWGNNSNGQLGTDIWSDSYTAVYTQSLE